jgi:hypothetical protein
MKVRPGVATAVFAGTTILLLIVAGVGFSLYFTSSGSTQQTTATMNHTTTEAMTETMGQTTTEVMTETMGQTTTEVMTQTATGTDAIQFTPATGQMVNSAWLLIQPTGSGQYAVSVNAQGLESTQGTGSIYIVEGAQLSGSMSVVPIGPNATDSEFETSGTGAGSYFILLNQDPFTTFENIQIVYLPGMQMTNATVVATATLAMVA